MPRRDAFLHSSHSRCRRILPRRRASQRPDPPRIAILDDATEASRHQLWFAFRNRLGELGYVEGRNASIETRFAGGSRDRSRCWQRNWWRASRTCSCGNDHGCRRRQEGDVEDSDRCDRAADRCNPGWSCRSPDPAAISRGWHEPGGDRRQVARPAAGLRPDAKSLVYLTIPGIRARCSCMDLEQRARSLGLASQSWTASVPRTWTRRSHRCERAVRRAGRGQTASLLNQRRQIVEGAARLRIPAVYARQEYVEAAV